MTIIEVSGARIDARSTETRNLADPGVRDSLLRQARRELTQARRQRVILGHRRPVTETKITK